MNNLIIPNVNLLLQFPCLVPCIRKHTLGCTVPHDQAFACMRERDLQVVHALVINTVTLDTSAFSYDVSRPLMKCHTP